MDYFAEKAPAKVNLTLRVIGKRPDGFHEISSLVAFAGTADTVAMAVSQASSFSAKGPFANALTGDENLVEQAVALFAKACPDAHPVSVKLEKHLPVAAGLGGGSADAAAVLRLLARSNADCLSAPELEEMAAALGSDIVVCLRSAASWMAGRGEKAEPIANFPRLPVVLANPGIPLSAGDVYRALEAPPVKNTGILNDHRMPISGSASDLIMQLREIPNDLQVPAVKLAPVISDVLDAIAATSGCALARMSGSGPTCFGIYGSDADAAQARQAIAERHPRWWVVKTTIG